MEMRNAALGAAMSNRFLVTSSTQVIFVDRLRLATFTDLRAFLTACAEDPDGVDLSQQPILFEIPKKDLRAYERACAAFNAVMDEHERKEAARLQRRRETAAARRSVKPTLRVAA